MDYYQYDLAVETADETFFPSSKRTLKEGRDRIVYQDGWGRVLETKRTAYFYRQIDSVLRKKSDLDKLNFESSQLDERYDDFLKGVNAQKGKRCTFCKIGGPFIRSSFIRGEAEWFIDLAADKSFAKALAEKVGDHLLEIGLESLSRGNLWDTGVWIYDDMGSNNGPLFSPKTFEEVFLPVYKRIVGTLKRMGARKIIFHSDGDIQPFLGMVIEAGIDGINPVEPRVGMDVVTLKREYGGKLSFIGGVCNTSILPRGTELEIENHVRPIVEAGRDGGIIIGSNPIGKDIPIENYEFYIQLVKKYGSYL